MPEVISTIMCTSLQISPYRLFILGWLEMMAKLLLYLISPCVQMLITIAHKDIINVIIHFAGVYIFVLFCLVCGTLIIVNKVNLMM